MYEILSPHVDELVVTGVSDSRGQKSDALDALHLAEQLRIGAIKCPVFKAPGQFSRLRELVLSALDARGRRGPRATAPEGDLPITRSVDHWHGGPRTEGSRCVGPEAPGPASVGCNETPRGVRRAPRAEEGRLRWSPHGWAMPLHGT